MHNTRFLTLHYTRGLSPQIARSSIPRNRVVMARSAGSTPNLYWNAVATEKLRSDPSYTALPPVATIAIDGIDTYRMIRQDSELWDALHQGVLTTGRLNASLGFYEERASKRLGISRGFTSHRALIAAYHHLLAREYLPPKQAASPDKVSQAPLGRKSLVSATQSGNPTARERKCTRAAASGHQSVRMAWGTAQEGATLYGIMQALPGSKLLEAGLFRLDESLLPGAWGFRKGDLPPLGASPDGLIWHPEGPCDIQDCLGAQLASSSAAAQEDQGKAQAAPGAPIHHISAGTAGVLADTAILRMSPIQGIAASSGRNQHSFGSTAAAGPGLQPASRVQAGGTGDPQIQEIEDLLQNLTVDGPEGSPEESGTEHPLSIQGWQSLRRRGTLEVVEVKNSSPFRTFQGSSVYQISDRGPAEQVLPLWVAQLQMEMMAADTASAIFVSRSATKGMCLYRVYRDDEFLRLMLLIIQKFYSGYVRRRHQPPRDMFYNLPEYQALLDRTIAVSHSSQLLAYVPDPKVEPSADRRAFLH